MSGSALEGGAIFEGEVQAAIRVGRGVVPQAAPELFAEGGDLAVLLLENSEEVLHHTTPFEDVADLLCDRILLGFSLFELLAEGIKKQKKRAVKINQNQTKSMFMKGKTSILLTRVLKLTTNFGVCPEHQVICLVSWLQYKIYLIKP